MFVPKTAPGSANAGSTLRTVSHTLHQPIAERLRLFAFTHRLSESSVIEHALAAAFASATDEELACELRAAGHGLRRRTG